MGKYQQGISVITLPVIVLVMAALVLFVFSVNHALLTKAKLDRLSYSLVTVVSVEPLKQPWVTDKQAITQKLADDLLILAKRHLDGISSDGDSQVGIELEQLKFLGEKNSEHWYGFQSGSECQGHTRLTGLADLSPKGGVEGFNLGKRAELFQVTVCLTDVKSVNGVLGIVNFDDFTRDYYKSSSLLIGRHYE
ncbi:tight adherence pilus pseudopilin TadF [Shewanella violacea]|uniref:Uncharacterized protein n=1 Tax=Shewanella violacea (strain JCM 10179 / CIP 106290 / LMG 19151 / DSS12) TaxID=637905 RepID=D4ZHC9_SHEVD|nr:tight adherence pilus pseudopilin TadF [Shewanella violacea]BAJ01078.1 hypothetical protein SVI_1107 [Shewanella violacea DSS12]